MITGDEFFSDAKKLEEVLRRSRGREGGAGALPWGERSISR
jgi:hypothetical protein